MKDQLLKRKSISFLTIFVLLSSISSCAGDYSGEINDLIEIKKDLKKILKKFAESEEEKDAEAHRPLFLSSSSTLNFVLKNNGNPNVVGLTRDQWISFFTSWDYEYFPEYSQIRFLIEDGMAVDSHLFKGFRDGQPDIFGNDLFMYVKTPSGWKIVNVSSTITALDDTVDYSGLSIDNDPEEVLSAFGASFNEKDEDAFKSLFTGELTPCFRFEEVFQEEYSDNKHSATSFFARLPGSLTGLKIDFPDTHVSIKDQFTALIAGKYIIYLEEEFVEKGNVLVNMTGTPEQGWKISGMLFSIKEQEIQL